MAIEKIEHEVFLHTHTISPNVKDISVFSYDLSDSGYLLLGRTTVVLEIDTDKMLQDAIQALYQRAQKERADGETKAQKLEEAAQKLLALPLKTTDESDSPELF